mmetsp:Transcript_5710/g.12047  ORF Transcript_5710/g.12047 Transcript_5710/m.12047 type:complete len:261 (+) Transcript_5710:44-826(+)
MYTIPFLVCAQHRSTCVQVSEVLSAPLICIVRSRRIYFATASSSPLSSSSCSIRSSFIWTKFNLMIPFLSTIPRASTISGYAIISSIVSKLLLDSLPPPAPPPFDCLLLPFLLRNEGLDAPGKSPLLLLLLLLLLCLLILLMLFACAAALLRFADIFLLAFVDFVLFFASLELFADFVLFGDNLGCSARSCRESTWLMLCSYAFSVVVLVSTGDSTCFFTSFPSTEFVSSKYATAAKVTDAAAILIVVSQFFASFSACDL